MLNHRSHLLSRPGGFRKNFRWWIDMRGLKQRARAKTDMSWAQTNIDLILESRGVLYGNKILTSYYVYKAIFRV